MQISTGGNFHLTYCTNIHPGEGWSEVFANLERYLPTLKARLAPERPFGIGLRLADSAARELLQGETLARFQAWLAERDLYVFTLNGFPYGGFHHQVVKDRVYAPDWRTRERLDYTVRLANILAALLPEGMDGGISTVPLSYKPWLIKSKAARQSTLRESSLHLARLVVELVRLHHATGKTLHLDLEPEPDGLIENSEETVAFFKDYLLPLGGAELALHLEIPQEQAEQRLLEHVRVCYDTCHFAVAYEEPTSVFARLRQAGIHIGKIQISAALKVPLSERLTERRAIAERLRPFVESTYLHQVIERRLDGMLYHYPDLSAALPHIMQPDAREWRIHFHVPIFIADYQSLYSTQDDIIATLDTLSEHGSCRHLEIETYTWEVLPQEMKLDIVASIQREYEWVLGAFIKSQRKVCPEHSRMSAETQREPISIP